MNGQKKGVTEPQPSVTRKSQPEVKPNKNWLEYTSGWIKSQISNGGFSMKNENCEVVKGGCDHSEEALMFNANACSICFGTMILIAIVAAII